MTDYAAHRFPGRIGVRRRRRFLIVSIAALAVLAAALGVSFAGPTGLTDVTVTSASNNFVFPVATSATAPSGLGALASTVYTTALKNTGTTGFSSTTGFFAASNVVTPSWAPVAGSAGSVTTAGDLAVLDARSATLGANFTALRVTVFITNLAALQASYSSFAFPLNVYQCTRPCDGTNVWSLATGYSATAPVFITSTDGYVSFSLPAATDRFYDIAMDVGGSFYTIATSGTLAPQFYFTAQAT